MSEAPVPHDPRWAALFEAEAAVLAKALADEMLAIHHIGSTAVPGIWAKPIIDMLIEVRDLADVDNRHPQIAAVGYEGKGEYGIPGRRYFRKHDAGGVRTHHLHIYRAGSNEIARHIAFRDYLRAHTGIAADYSQIKQTIAADWRGMEDYIARKSPFVIEIQAHALDWFRAGKA